MQRIALKEEMHYKCSVLKNSMLCFPKNRNLYSFNIYNMDL